MKTIVILPYNRTETILFDWLIYEVSPKRSGLQRGTVDRHTTEVVQGFC